MPGLWRCEICGDPYVGETAPNNCPFCGAHQQYIKNLHDAVVDFDVKLNETDRENVEKALQVEISNSAFYFCAAGKTNNEEGKLLFKALGKIEAEHAAIWKKILKLHSIAKAHEVCSVENITNLQESNTREVKAIYFYTTAGDEAENKRVKQIFRALTEVESDHLALAKDLLARRDILHDLAI